MMPIDTMLRRALRGALAAALAAVLLGATHDALSQTWPVKPIRWIVPFAAGGPADVIARMVSGELAKQLGQPVIIDNRAGGAANIGHEAAARSAPDGYTILYAIPSVVTNVSLLKSAVDPIKELTPVARLTTQAYVLLASPGFAPRTLAEIVAAAKDKPGSVSCASGGGLPALGCEWLKSVTRAEIVHVPYKGNAPALNDLIGGQVSVLIDLFNTALPQIRSGKVRAVALTSETRGPPLPELPVMAETLPGFVLVGWHGVMAPAGVPRPIIEQLNRAFGQALADPEVNKRISDSQITVAHSSAEAFGRIIETDLAKYARIVRDAGIKPE